MPAPTVPPPAPKAPSPQNSSGQSFSIDRSVGAGAQFIGIYGPGGAGKTSLIRTMENIGKKPLILDADDGSLEIEVDRVGASDGLVSWATLRAVLADGSLWNEHDVVVIDTVTTVQDWATEHIVRTEGVEGLEDAYGGYGKGYRRLYEMILSLISDCDKHRRAGRDVVWVMHDCVCKTPNPAGEDFLTCMPNLYASEKNNVRCRVKELVSHLLYIGYDVASAKGKGKGTGSRTIYTSELPSHWAKSRTLCDSFPYVDENDGTIWEHIFKKRSK